MPVSPCGPSLCPVLLPLPALHRRSSLTNVPLTKLQLSARFQRALTATEVWGGGGVFAIDLTREEVVSDPLAKETKMLVKTLFTRALVLP